MGVQVPWGAVTGAGCAGHASVHAIAITCTYTIFPATRVRGGFLSFLGGISYQIRILLYRDVSCMYPVEYMHPGCILMYLKCILNALLNSKRIMYLDILDVFYTYLKRVQDTCRIHIRYIRIHVSYALP